MKLFAAILALGALATPLHSQSVDVDDLRARLASENDIPTLRRRDFGLRRATATSTDALLERGLVLVRLYELTREADDAKQAQDLFDRLIKKTPDDPHAYYARGIGRIAGPGVRIPSPGGVLNSVVIGQSFAEIAKRDPISLAKRDFKKALELDPALVGPAIQLANTSLDTRDRDNMQAAAIALRSMVAQKRGGHEAATALSQIEEALGNVEAAGTAAETATTLADSSSQPAAAVSAALARAVALLRQPTQIEAGARAYFEGVDRLTQENAVAYYAALAPIVNEREEAAWQTADLESRKEWLKRFWTTRAAISGVTVAERMAEHFKRLAVAQDKYRRESSRGAAPSQSLVLTGNDEVRPPFDDRGIIYVRHGAPAEIVRTADVDLRPNETWVYRGNGKDRLYHFIVLRSSTDFRLVDDLLAALDPSTTGVPAAAAAKLLRDRQAYEPRYAALAQKFDNYDRALNFRMLGAAGTGRAAAAASENAQNISTDRIRIASDMRAEALKALHTDTDAPHFEGELPFYYDFYAFKGKDGFTDVTAAAAVPGTSLFSARRGSQYIYAVQASLIFMDTLTNEITRKDTVFTFWSSRVLREREHLRLTMDMVVPLARTGVHRIVLRDLTNPGVGQLYGGLSEVKNFAGESLMLSDIVLAESDDGNWRRGLARLALVPPRQFAEKKPVKIFYEIYNLPAEVAYRTEISMTPVEGISGFGRIKKLFGRKGSDIALQFEGLAQPNADGTVQELRQVVAEVKPGKYRIAVRVTNLQNQQSVRTETVFIVGEQK